MRTLIILGHPNLNSFTNAACTAYEKGAREKKGEVKRINLSELNFNPILENGYSKIQNLEPDLIKAQQLISWANHIVIVFPVWWSAPPALLKGFIDRVFLPGFAFRYREKSSMWDKLLKGRSARLIILSDAPVFWLYFAYFHPALNLMKKAVLEFCGISPVRVSSFGSIKNKTSIDREKILEKCYREGLQDN